MFRADPFFMLLFSTLALSAQTAIKGSIRDIKNKPVPAATVTIKRSDGKISVFTRADEKGNFMLQSPATTDSLYIEVSNLGYKKERQLFKIKQTEYTFTLQESTIDLPTVVINNNPTLKTSGDTLSYRLSDFSEKQDRVLGDVLKKMPGIEVSESGKISYNGKNISNLYVDGDNLLDDKYNIATKSIPKEAVDKVQVIENDQPIKMLRNKSNSDDIALNITIKDEAKLKLIGQASLGAGLPERFDENINGMTFNKKYKGINYLKGNNIGNDPASDLTSHNMQDYLKRLDNNKRTSILSTGAAGIPDLPQNRYLFNQAGLLNVNNLFNLRNDMQIKTNFYYLRDKQLRDYSKFTEIYLPTGNISYTENQDNTSRPDQLHAQVGMNRNREKSYINNVFIADYNPVKYKVGLITNSNPLSQSLKQDVLDISNEFNYMNTLKSGYIYNIYSYLNYINQPEQLVLTPGLNEQQLNNNQPYARLVQNTEAPSYFSNNHISFKNVSGAIIQTYKAGFSLQAQQLQSDIEVLQLNGNVTPPSVDAINNLKWNQTKLYAEGLFEYKSEDEKVRAGITIPVNQYRIEYNDPGFALNNTINRFFLNPTANIRYQTGIENYLSLSYSLKNQLGGMDDVYRGGILKNYRNLFSNDAPVSEQETNSLSMGFNYRKAITMFFFSLQASYSKIELNTISASIITNNLQQRIVLPFENDINTYNLSGNISKYLFALSTTVSAGLSWSQNSANQIQNNELLPYKNYNNEVRLGFQSKITPSVSVDYTARYNQMISKSSVPNTVDISFNQLKQKGILSLNMIKAVYINLSAEHLYTSQSGQDDLSYVFSDFSVRHKVNKINTDFEFGLTNLTNVKSYKAVYLSANSFTASTYRIPGRVAMFKASFNF